MKKLFIAAAALTLVAATVPSFIVQAQAWTPPKHAACSLSVPDLYLESFKDRYNCWGWPYPYFETHEGWWRW